MTTNPKKTVLVVDDDKTLTVSLKTTLENEGYNVLVAEDGEEALKLIGTNHVDLILLDILMPKMDGQTFAYQLYKIEKDIPIIVLTNLTQVTHQDFIKEVVVKSNVSLREIVEKIKKYI